MILLLEDVYRVIEATVPLYVALILGYFSVKKWRLFTADHCNAINQLVCYFTLPLFNFEFTAQSDPFKWNYKFLAADAISKIIIIAAIAIWVKCSSKGDSCWSITSFSLSTLTNSFVVGVPLLGAMYGQLGVDLVVQFSVVQAIAWLTILLFVLEFRRSRMDFSTGKFGPAPPPSEQSQVHSVVEVEGNEDLEARDGVGNIEKPSLWSLMKVVGIKLARNPNSYSCFVGIAWAFLSCRFHLQMPSIVEGSVLILSRAGTGTAMFSMGMFMGSQEKLIACGARHAILGMILKFVAGPAAMGVASILVGLRDDVLRIAIIQAAIPQSITSFIYAKEYGLHADVISTAVIFGMIVSLPVMIGYYAILDTLH